jgi:diguanylate cyclase (GGDEF)-like protein
MAFLDQRAAKFGLRVVVPAILVLACTFGIVLFSLSRMANDVDRIESRVTVKTVEAAVNSLLERLALAHGEYAVLGAAINADQRILSPLTIAKAFSATTAVSSFYDTAYVIDGSGRAVFSFRNGRALTTPASVEFGRGLDVLLERLAKAPDIRTIETGLIETRNGLAAVAVGFTGNQSGVAAGARLILARAFGTATTAELGARYLIPNLRLSFSRTQGDGVVLSDPLGRVIGTLYWDPPGSGQTALRSVAPVVLAILLFVGALVAALIVFAWRSLVQIETGERQAHEAIRHDPLTGLPNRLAGRERLNEMISEARTLGQPLSVAQLDLDDFKQVNDTYGHVTGDRLLCLVAEKLEQFGQEVVDVFRSGGDEFSLCAFDDGTRLQQIGDRLIDYLSKPINIEGRVVVVGASIGIAACRDENMSREELLRRTELAMYRAKEEGGNRVAVYHNAMDTALHERIAIAADLRDAIMAGELDVVYQPVFDAATRTVVSAEALVRWRRRGHGDVPPDVFIPIAEQSGLIGTLGTVVLRRACRDAQRWPFIAVSVNVSPAQFRDPSFEHLLAEILADTGIEPRRLILEITETYLIADPGRAKRAIDAVRAMGISVALDDFGTGFSSIGYLRQFTFDHLKLDRSVVADIALNAPAQRLIQATVALADALGLNVTAEGVETEEDALILRVAGCRNLQGFLLSRPVSAEQLTRQLSGPSASSERALSA